MMPKCSSTLQQVRPQGGGQVLDRSCSSLHPGHGRQRERPDGPSQGRRIQEKVSVNNSDLCIGKFDIIWIHSNKYLPI